MWTNNTITKDYHLAFYCSVHINTAHNKDELPLVLKSSVVIVEISLAMFSGAAVLGKIR